MLARVLRPLILLLATLSALWSITCIDRDAPTLAVLPLVIVSFIVPALFTVEFALLFVHLRRNGRQDPDLAALCRAALMEAATALRIFLWQQPFRSQRWPDLVPTTAQGRVGVLLVHGFVCNRGLWNRWLERLHRASIPCIAVNLEPVFGSISDYESTIDAAVERLRLATGCPPVVVAHSMGGLAVRHWWTQQAARVPTPTSPAAIQRLMTLGTPHRGTWLARWAITRNSRQMQLNSAWVEGLQAREPIAHRRATSCFFSACDNIVFPAQTATLPDADNRELEAVAHVAMIDHPEPWRLLLQWTSAPDADHAPSTLQDEPR